MIEDKINHTTNFGGDMSVCELIRYLEQIDDQNALVYMDTSWDPMRTVRKIILETDLGNDTQAVVLKAV